MSRHLSVLERPFPCTAFPPSGLAIYRLINTVAWSLRFWKRLHRNERLKLEKIAAKRNWNINDSNVIIDHRHRRPSLHTDINRCHCHCVITTTAAAASAGCCYYRYRYHPHWQMLQASTQFIGTIAICFAYPDCGDSPTTNDTFMLAIDRFFISFLNFFPQITKWKYQPHPKW